MRKIKIDIKRKLKPVSLKMCLISVHALKICLISVHALKMCLISVHALKMCLISVHALKVCVRRGRPASCREGRGIQEQVSCT